MIKNCNGKLQNISDIKMPDRTSHTRQSMVKIHIILTINEGNVWDVKGPYEAVDNVLLTEEILSKGIGLSYRLHNSSHVSPGTECLLSCPC